MKFGERNFGTKYSLRLFCARARALRIACSSSSFFLFCFLRGTCSSGGPACCVRHLPFLTAVYWAASVSAALGLLPKQDGPSMCASLPFLFLFENKMCFLEFCLIVFKKKKDFCLADLGLYLNRNFLELRLSNFFSHRSICPT